MAEAVVSMALKTLGDLLLEEARFLSGVSNEVKGLEKQLKEIKCLLEDADRRHHESKTILNWISEIKDLTHRAEDAIETYASQIPSNRKLGLKQLLNRFSCVLDKCFSLHEIGSEISEIKSEIARITKSMQEYGIRDIIQGESSAAAKSDENQQWKRRSYPVENEDFFVGKDDDLKRLVSLTSDDKQNRVISLWGMGGIGKTTIARKVYNHNETKRCFEAFAWVCITQQCRIRSVLEDVLKQLIPQQRDYILNLSDTQLIQRLAQIQKDKRCMIVLDDLWQIDHWDGLKHAFLVQGSKSKILLTTRNRKVADVGFAFEIEILSSDDGLELLKKKAFPHSIIPDFVVDEKILLKIGREMVQKCSYLPLVISLLGGLLSKKKSVEEWELVNENIIACLHMFEGIGKENDVYGSVMNLSYEDLPYYLKPCFLYLGQFDDNYRIPVKTLYRLWIAEGMISHESIGKEESLMDIAELYLSELASRCIVLVQVVDNEVVRSGKYKFCKLHDVVREFCLSKGKKDFGFHVMDYRDYGKSSTYLPNDQSLLGSIKPRYLVIHLESKKTELDQYDQFRLMGGANTCRYLRSLQFLNGSSNGKTIDLSHAVIDFRKFNLLRSLRFERFKFASRKLPRGIENLIHLRYLCLRECVLDELPSSISNLTYLYTPDLFGSWNVRVPNTLEKMYRLKHLVLPFYNEEKIGNNHQLLKLEGLDELETVDGFNSLVHDLKSIIKMKNLRLLFATINDNYTLSEFVNAVMTRWKKLRYCALAVRYSCRFTSMDEDMMILKKLFTCPNLHQLSIMVHMGRQLLQQCESQIVLSRVVVMRFRECEIEDDPMEILGKLPNLEKLSLSNKSFVGKEMKCHALGFPSLKKLALEHLPNLRMWRVEQGSMPFLAEIEINYCSRLEMIPNGLRFIDTVQKLKISGMSALRKRVLASPSPGGGGGGGEDFNKVRHVPSIIIIGDE